MHEEEKNVESEADDTTCKYCATFRVRGVPQGIERHQEYVEEEKDGTLQARHKTTHLSFFHYSYPLLRPLRSWGSLQIAHPVDIGLMKIGAIIGRGSRKDFMDLYVILQKEISLPRLLRLASKKFPGRDLRFHACRAMVYFADADREPTPKLLAPLDWPKIKDFFERETRKIVAAFR